MSDTSPTELPTTPANRRPSQPYEHILTGGSADAVLEKGWKLGAFEPISLTPPIDWSYRGESWRSHNFHLHSLDLVDPLLRRYSETGDDLCFDTAYAVARDWVARHPRRDTPDISPMAWYDMAVGIRAYRLAYVFDAARRRGGAMLADLIAMSESLELHAEMLSDDAQFAAHSNHGFYQACGQIAMGRRLPDVPGMDEAYEGGLARLDAILRTQFTEEGVHKEHSPDYHRAVLESLTALIDVSAASEHPLRTVVEQIEDSLSWFIKPSGLLANFGDTDTRQMQRGKAQAAKWQSPALQWQTSRGALGRPPESPMRAFPASGYFVVRNGAAATPEDMRRQSYLAQTLAFHSRTHKHADDLSFIWSDRGRDILLDAGRYGYRGKTVTGDPLWAAGFWYNDPARVYVESTHAHNTLEIDSESYNRRKTKPYGSALRFAGETPDRLFYSEGWVKQGGVQHSRTLVFDPGRWLLILDWAYDNLRLPHTYTQWFHLAPDLIAAVTSPESFAVRSNLPGETFQMTAAALLPGVKPIPVILGQDGDRKQGWRSLAEGQLTPSPSIGFTAQKIARTSLATLFALDDDIIADWNGSRTNSTGTKSVLKWQAGGRRRKLMLDRDDKGLDVRFEWDGDR